MDSQIENTDQKLDFDKPYDAMQGLNIKFEGLLTLELTDKHANSKQFLNEYLSKATDNVRCQKADHIGTSYELHCTNDNKQDAINSIKDFLSIILIREEIRHLKACINISLSSFNHEDKNCIDYNFIKHNSDQFFDVLPRLLEPVEPQFIAWDGETWFDTPY